MIAIAAIVVSTVTLQVVVPLADQLTLTPGILGTSIWHGLSRRLSLRKSS